MKQVIKLNKTDNAYYMDCNEAILEDGNRRLLHNEVGCSFIVDNGNIKVLSGWHIGTEDFDFDEGDDWVLEHYHPGITEQLLEEVRKYEKDNDKKGVA